MNGKVVAAYCTGGDVAVEFMQCMRATELDRPWLLEREHVVVIGGPRLHVFRTEAVRQFLQGDGEWLWFTDTDMAWAADALWELFKVANPETHPIVGGLCFGTSRTAGGLFPTIYYRDDHGRYCMSTVDIPEDEVMRVDATGFAFILAHRTVFERMAAPEAFGLQPDGTVDLLPWFVDGQCGDVLMEGDLSFCARAAALDIPIHVHSGVDVLHKKPAMHGRALYESVLEMQRTRGAV